jgi:hypothetical protein
MPDVGRTLVTALLLFTCAAVEPLAQAQPAPGGPQQRTQVASVSRQQLAQVLSEIEQLIRTRYVVEEKREPIIRRLRQSRDAGRYSVTAPGQLAELITADLKAASGDGHLSVGYDPAGAERLRSPSGVDFVTARRREALALNHGLTETRLLPGNVRYLKIARFDWVPDRTGAAYDDAMRFLSGGDAVIVDVRGNSGGSASAVRYAVSHFLDGEDEPLLMTFSDDEGRPDQSRVLGHLPAGRITGRPVYVLTDGLAASAAEEFAYHIQQFKAGKLVGAKTAGAANNNRFFPVSHGFIASISYFQPVHALSRSNWEGTGVSPDIPSDAGRALESAHVAALEALAGRAAGDARARYEWMLPFARGRLHPPVLSADELRRYEGRFGRRSLRVEDGALVHYAPGLPPLRLVPLSEHVFAFPDTQDLRLEFEVENGRAKAIHVRGNDGGSRTIARTG